MIESALLGKPQQKSPDSDVFCDLIAGVEKPARFGLLFGSDRPQNDRLSPKSEAKPVLTMESVRTRDLSFETNYDSASYKRTAFSPAMTPNTTSSSNALPPM
jgi:hypothetical protein